MPSLFGIVKLCINEDKYYGNLLLFGILRGSKLLKNLKSYSIDSSEKLSV